MEFQDAVKKRHSVRDFSNQPVSKEDLTAIVNLAKLSPSWANSQTWQVIIATGDTLEKIRAHHLKTVQQGVPGDAEIPSLHREQMGNNGIKNVANWMTDFNGFIKDESQVPAMDSAHLFNAPAVAYLLIPQNPSLWEAYDLGSFGQTLMLAASDRGIDSIPAMELVQYPQSLHEILNVSDQYIFALGIALGYRNSDSLINKFRSSRMDNQDFLTFKE